MESFTVNDHEEQFQKQFIDALKGKEEIDSPIHIDNKELLDEYLKKVSIESYEE